MTGFEDDFFTDKVANSGNKFALYLFNNIC